LPGGGSSGLLSAEGVGSTFGFGPDDGEIVRSGGGGNRQTEAESSMDAAGNQEAGEGAAVEGQLTAGLRQILLEQLVGSLASLRQVGGRCTIPYMQLVLALTTDLDPEDERDVAALRSLLTALLRELDMGGEVVEGEKEAATASYAERSQQREFQLIILRLLSVLMSRCSRSSTAAAASQSETAENFVARTVAATLAAHGMHCHCRIQLKNLMPYWQSQTGPATVVADEAAAAAAEPPPLLLPGSQLLKPAPPTPLPDMAPFFLKQYVKTHAADIFEAYPQLLTEMVLRLPYQMKKIAESGLMAVPHFEPDWLYQLCELLATPQAPFVKRQVRKLLLLICGSRDQYRQLRDMHTLETKMR
jgi:E3 ubiquitin-protein ligase UBR4